MLGLDVIFARRYMNVEFDVWFSMLGFFDAPYVETFYVKFSTYGTSKILRMSLSVIEAYDQQSYIALCIMGKILWPIL